MLLLRPRTLLMNIIERSWSSHAMRCYVWKKWNTGNALKLTGLPDLDEFMVTNAQQNGKTFENFFLQLPQLNMEKVNSIVPDHYPRVRYSLNSRIRYLLPEVDDVTCESDFPSSNQ